MTSGVFVTGTDTGVGKTVVSAVLARALGADYWKPVQSGVAEGLDADEVRRLAGLGPERVHPSTYLLTEPLSPHEAARRERVRIELGRFALPATARPLVVEGAGGVLVPLADDALMADLMQRLRLPVLLVARTSLGTINHTLLSLEALRARGLAVAGVVLVGPEDPPNQRAIERYGQVEVLACIPRLEPLSPEAIGRAAEAARPALRRRLNHV